MSNISETRLSHLKQLEAESIHIMREVVTEFNNPIMLYSIGKDSSVMLHLAKKAFYPAAPPFKLLHVDTTWKFKDMIKFRAKAVAESGMELITHINPDGLAMDISPFTHGSKIHTDIMKTQGLKQALDHYGFDAAFGGARRDEEGSALKNVYFHSVLKSTAGTPKTNVPSYGICLIPELTKAKASEFSQFLTGLN